MRADRADRFGALRVAGIAATSGRGARVDLIDDEEVETTGIDVGVRRQDIAQQAHRLRSLEPVNRDDEPREALEWIGSQSPGAAQLAEHGGVDNPELESEAIGHLGLPLERERSRTHDVDGPRAVPEQKLLHDEAGLDRLAQTDVVGDQKRGARGAQRPNHGLELVVLDRDARTEGRLERAAVGGRDRAPSNGVQESIEAPRVVEPVNAGMRQRGCLQDECPGFDLPDHREFLGQPIVFDRRQLREMLDA